jgi:hypothetical protein
MLPTLVQVPRCACTLLLFDLPPIRLPFLYLDLINIFLPLNSLP